MDFWLDRITAGFITEFALDIVNYYNTKEKAFLKGYKVRYIRSLYISINILLYKNSVMTMEEDN